MGSAAHLVDRGLQRRGDVGGEQLQPELDRIVGRLALADEAGQGHQEDQEREQGKQAHIGDVARHHPAIVLVEIVIGLPKNPSGQPEDAFRPPLAITHPHARSH